jgi:N-acetylglucosamine-6-phosphate deacetylase
MILLAGADLVLPDRMLPRSSLLIDDDTIAAIEPRVIDTPQGATRIDLHGSIVVPGFVDVHVHGIEGVDVLDGADAIRLVAARLPRYGVTAFCPTSVACSPGDLRVMLEQVAAAREEASPDWAQVLPAHLESNFINPEYRGAQPLNCIRQPRRSGPIEGDYSGQDILDTIRRFQAQVGIVTLAPEIDGGLDLVRGLSEAGHRVSIGHSGASFDQTLAAIDAGVSHATHLFNRMTPMSHRAPGVPGAVLASERVTAEVICDGFHVHPSLVRVALRAKGVAGIMAITDGTAGSGLPVGSRARLGGRTIVVTKRTAELEDGTLAGSVLTMDGAFRMLVQSAEVSIIEAARACATTPAEQLRLHGRGRVLVGAIADLVVLDQHLAVRGTLIAGRICRNTGLSALV